MAFVAATPFALARELWPSGIGKLQQDKHLDLKNLRASRVLPRDSDQMLQWMFVQLVDRGRWAQLFMHPSVDGAKGSPEVVIRLQGIIEETNLGVYGDWDQMEANAKNAMQKLVLGGVGCRDAFVPQLQALENVRETVSMMAGVCPKRGGGGSTIVLRRRVFTKVNVDTPSSVITEDEDPSGVLDSIGDKWRITSRVKCGSENAGGGIDSLHGLSFRRGDMVDVSVTVIGLVIDGPSGKRCNVIFEPKTVVRLACADVVEGAIREAARVAAIARRRPTSTRTAMEEGFAFDEKRRRITQADAEKKTAHQNASGEVEPEDVMQEMGGIAEGAGAHAVV